MKPRKPDGSTYVCSTWGYVMEKRGGRWYRQHRLIMEDMIGRPLKRGEVVHHRDHDRTNNDPTNLELMSDSEHRSHHAKMKGRYSKATLRKMSQSAKRVASEPEELKRRSERAKQQHREGRFGRSTWHN